MQLDGLAELEGSGPLVSAHGAGGSQPLLHLVTVTLKFVADEAKAAASAEARTVRPWRNCTCSALRV